MVLVPESIHFYTENYLHISSPVTATTCCGHWAGNVQIVFGVKKCIDLGTNNLLTLKLHLQLPVIRR